MICLWIFISDSNKRLILYKTVITLSGTHCNNIVCIFSEKQLLLLINRIFYFYYKVSYLNYNATCVDLHFEKTIETVE